MTKPRDNDDVDRGNRALLSSVARANGVVSTSLHRAIRQHARNEEYDARKDGLDFLQAKNGLMTSYLVDLTLLLRCRLNARGRRKNDGGEEDGDGGEGEGERSEGESNDARRRRECLERLLETRTALEKLRPMEKRMRYQIDKLLALSTLGAGTFAAVGREEEEEEERRRRRSVRATTPTSATAAIDRSVLPEVTNGTPPRNNGEARATNKREPPARPRPSPRRTRSPRWATSC
mmetsp:Transcript_7932/g.17153  ORF Transcript_7932/g.17153 Transcript_7932/m.17153 type:complete len:234 (+) Transcript_7932:200-901(+)